MLVIFDFDGPLRNMSWPGLFNAYQALLRFRGKNPADYFTDMESFRSFWMPDWRQLEKKFGGPFSPETEAEANVLFHECYDAHAKLHPWVQDIITPLAQNHTLTILSSSSVHSVRQSLGHLEKLFSFVAGCEHVQKLKPDPEGVHMMLKKFSANPEETVMIGDAEVDLIAGKAAGVKTGFVHWSNYCTIEKLRSHNPDYEFVEPEDFLKTFL